MKKILTGLISFGRVLTLASAPLLLQQILSVDSPWQLGSVVQAAEEKTSSESKYKTVKTAPIRQAVSKDLGKVQKLLEAEDWAAGLVKIKSIFTKRKNLNGNELANLYNLKAYAELSKENYSAAIKSYKKVTEQTEASPSLQLGALKYLGQLYMQQSQWQPAIAAFKEWMNKSDIVGSDTYYLLSQCYYQKNDYKGSLNWVTKAVDNYTGKGKVPNESWYNMQAALFYETGKIDSAINVFENLIKHYNKPKYWVSVAGMYGMRERSRDQLHAMDAAYVMGALQKESELTTLAALYMQVEVPFKAARVLDKGITAGVIEASAKNLQAMGNAYSMAQEKKKAISALEKAAKKSDQGRIYYQLGAMYLDDEKYQLAKVALRGSLDKGGLRSKGMAQLYLGQTFFYLKDFKTARKYLVKATEEEKSKANAVQWMSYMDKEIKRMETLKI